MGHKIVAIKLGHKLCWKYLSIIKIFFVSTYLLTISRSYLLTISI